MLDAASFPRKMAYLRLGYTVAALFTPKLATAAIGARPSQVTPAAMGWAAFFATREAALGVVTLESERLDVATRRKTLLLCAAVDGLDMLSVIALIRRQRSIVPLFMALPWGALSVIMHLRAAQQLKDTSGTAGATFENAYATA